MQIPEPRIPRRIKTPECFISPPGGSHSHSDLRTPDLQYSNPHTQRSLKMGGGWGRSRPKKPKGKTQKQEFHSFLNNEWKSAWLWARSPAGVRRQRPAVNTSGDNVLRTRAKRTLACDGYNSIRFKITQVFSCSFSSPTKAELCLKSYNSVEETKWWSEFCNGEHQHVENRKQNDI